ncbi:hypothetical protein C5B96_13880 [Subtercola sp. Z020]|uniref:hypothetical protein n=1 Tax=Subtercola sp. Z020 TaxID=2080582 RepID=UPI000CE80A98|nr:hypothetical protein [Subtercola sp. Z020]PPF78918.1 hypothetical protein C5B96_13880 [Subtercola sp. Z020]
MGEAPMYGRRWPDGRARPYDPLPKPPYNEAKALAIGRPLGHLESERLGLRGYSIHSVNGVPELIESGYCPLDWASTAPDVRSTSVQTGFAVRVGVDAEQERRQLLLHAANHLHNSHPYWKSKIGKSEYDPEWYGVREALEEAVEFPLTIDFEGRATEVQAFDHLGDRFARLALPDQGVIVTIAGLPEVFGERFTLRLPRSE